MKLKKAKPKKSPPRTPRIKKIAPEFDALFQAAAKCKLCPRMADQLAVLGPGNGPRNAKILFIAEAPGRFGAGRTGIPFSGDKSGENFETLLAHAGLTRKDVFITNAVLCNPLKDGNNSRPTSAEIKNCSGFLRSTIDLIRPRLVVTLGGVALDAVNRLLQTRYQLKADALRPVTAPDFILLPLYHPSPRVANWKRPLRLQKRDFAKIPKLIPGKRPEAV